MPPQDEQDNLADLASQVTDSDVRQRQHRRDVDRDAPWGEASASEAISGVAHTDSIGLSWVHVMMLLYPWLLRRTGVILAMGIAVGVFLAPLAWAAWWFGRVSWTLAVAWSLQGFAVGLAMYVSQKFWVRQWARRGRRGSGFNPVPVVIGVLVVLANGFLIIITITEALAS